MRLLDCNWALCWDLFAVLLIKVHCVNCIMYTEADSIHVVQHASMQDICIM